MHQGLLLLVGVVTVSQITHQTPSSTASFDVGISRHSAFSPGASILSSTTPMRRCGMDPGAYAEESAKLIQRCDNATALIREIQARKRGEPDGM